MSSKVVLSLFDGISCGQVALNNAGIRYDRYLASENRGKLRSKAYLGIAQAMADQSKERN